MRGSAAACCSARRTVLMRAGNIAVCFAIVLGLDAVPALARQDAILPDARAKQRRC